MALSAGEAWRRPISAVIRSPLLRGAGAHVFAQVLQSVVTLLFVVLYARRMSPAEYGAIVAYTSLFTLISLLFYLSLREKAYFALLGREDDGAVTVSTIVWCMLAIALVAVPALCGAAWVYRDRVIFGLPLVPHVFLAQFSAIGVLLVATLTATLQAVEKLARAAAFQLVAFFAFALLNVTLLLQLGMRSESYVYAHAAAYGGCGLLAAVWLFRTHGARFSWQHAVRAVAFSLPLVAHHLAHWGRAQLDRLILATVFTTAVTGVYGMAVVYGSLPLLLVDAFGLAYGPRFFRWAADAASNGARIGSVLALSVGATAAIGTLLSLFAQGVFQAVAAPEYWPASAYVPMIAAAVCLYAVYVNAVPVLMYRKRTRLVSTATVTSCAAGMGAAVALLPWLGIWAMPLGVLLLNACMAGTICVMARREMDLPWPWRTAWTFCLLPLLSYAPVPGGSLLGRAVLGVAILGYIAFFTRPFLGELVERQAPQPRLPGELGRV